MEINISEHAQGLAIPEAPTRLHREPDIIEGGPAYSHTLKLWLPGEATGGLAVLDWNDQGGEYPPSAYKGIHLTGDLFIADLALRKLTVGMPDVYRYLGITVRRSLGQVAIGFPHGRTFVNRLHALPFDRRLRPPAFIFRPEGMYSKEDFFRTVVDDRAFLLAENGPYAVHDLITHTLPAHMLVPPRGMDEQSATCEKALAAGSEFASIAMSYADVNLSSSHYGMAVGDAMCAEAITPYPTKGMSPYTADHWDKAVRFIYAGADSLKRRRIAAQLRTYCIRLNAAARSVDATGAHAAPA